MSATDNIVRDDLALNNLALNNLALGARLRVAELADVQAMHRMETTLFPADAWHIDMFLEELTHPTRTYYMLEYRWRTRKATRAAGVPSATAEPWS